MLPALARPWKGQESPEPVHGTEELGSAGKGENPGKGLAEQKAPSDWASGCSWV